VTISQQGPATPDHVIRTKRTPMLGTDVGRYVAEYSDTSESTRRKRRSPRPCSIPRRVSCSIPRSGWPLRADREGCGDRGEIYGHTIDVILRAEALGGFQALPRGLLTDMPRAAT